MGGLMVELTLDLTDLRYTFTERNAGRGLVWLRDRLGHSGVAVTERCQSVKI